MSQFRGDSNNRTPRRKFFGDKFDIVECICVLAIPIGSFLMTSAIVGMPLFFGVLAIVFSAFESRSYKERTYAELKSEKDEYLIWGAAGSLCVALLDPQKISFLKNDEYMVNLVIAAFYILSLMAIHYRRLSAELYRREEEKTSVIIMSKNRPYTVTSMPNAEEPHDSDKQ